VDRVASKPFVGLTHVGPAKRADGCATVSGLSVRSFLTAVRNAAQAHLTTCAPVPLSRKPKSQTTETQSKEPLLSGDAELQLAATL